MPGTLFAQILGQQQVVVVAGQVTDELLDRFKAHGAEAAAVSVLRVRPVRGGNDVPVHRAQVLQQVGLLLEHGHAKAAGERLLASMDAQMGLEVPTLRKKKRNKVLVLIRVDVTQYLTLDWKNFL